MNILYFDHYAGSIYHGRGFRPYYLGKEWAKNGHKLFVVAGSYSHLRYKQPNKTGIEEIDGISYLWLWTPNYSKNGIMRFLSMLIFMMQIFINIPHIIKCCRPGVVIASSVYMLDMIPAWFIKKICKIKLIFELHDIWPASLIELGNLSPYHPFVLFMGIIEKLTYKLADKIVSILPCTHEYLKKNGIREEQLFIVPNGVNVEDWEEAEPLDSSIHNVISDIKNENTFLIGYAGAFGIANYLDALLRVAEKCVNGQVKFCLIGNGEEKEKLQNYIENKNLQNVIILPSISKNQIPNFLKHMDALYIGLKPTKLMQYGASPNKVFDYMMAKKPLIYGINSSNDYSKIANCGIKVDPEDLEACSDAIIAFTKLPKSKLNQMGENGYTYAKQNHNYTILANRFLHFIQNSPNGTF